MNPPDFGVQGVCSGDQLGATGEYFGQLQSIPDGQGAMGRTFRPVPFRIRCKRLDFPHSFRVRLHFTRDYVAQGTLCSLVSLEDEKDVAQCLGYQHLPPR
jgi:hypothetical protein